MTPLNIVLTPADQFSSFVPGDRGAAGGVRVPAGRSGGGRMGAVRHLPEASPPGGDGAPVASVRAPVPRRLRRRVAARAPHLPALPRRRPAAATAACLTNQYIGVNPVDQVESMNKGLRQRRSKFYRLVFCN
jgi:hypothetical protein